MAETFTKLFSSIVASTVWQEPSGTRLTWITMLAMADKNGVVEASIPGLANIANVTVEECERAIQAFLAPDKWSRTPDNEGRRIEAVYGGWRLLNHALYRAKADSEQRAEYKREWDRNNRKRSDTNPTESDKSGQNPAVLTQAEAETESKAGKAKATVQPLATPNPFDRWWATYPNKQGKEPARKKWASLKLDAHADEIIAATAKLAAEDDKWLRGFVPMGSTFINQQRWTDEPMAAPLDGNSKLPAKAPPPESFGPAAAMQPSETPLERDLAYCRQRWERGEFENRDSYTEAMKSIRREYSA